MAISPSLSFHERLVGQKFECLRLVFLLCLENSCFAAKNESNTELNFSNEAIDELSNNIYDHDYINADHETDKVDLNNGNIASTASNYNKSAPKSCSATFYLQTVVDP